MKDTETDGTTDLKTLITKVCSQHRIPTATYRLQFNRKFTFRQAEAIVGFLADLGISDCYASPIFKARQGSMHGYDICDHSQLNPELGSRNDFLAFCSTLKSRAIGLVLDVVPNHMGIADTSNLWWSDVLEIGPSSPYASYFDIDWHPTKPDLDNKVLLPVLEDQYGKVLESQKLRLAYEEGAFFLYYYETKLPIAPRTYSRILGHSIDQLTEQLGPSNEHLQELQSIMTALSYLPPRTAQSPEKIAERIREKEIIKRRISVLCSGCAEVQSAVASAIEAFNGKADDPRSFDMLDDLVEAQPYRPAFWRVAGEEINYRRFFDVNELAAIRVELPEVFHATHDLLFQLLTEGRISGLRIDHPDGLWDPPTYFRQLQENFLVRKLRSELELTQKHEPKSAATLRKKIRSAVSSWTAAESALLPSQRRWPLYVVAEKILSPGESLPANWAVHGTTGYDFLAQVNGLFLDNGNQKAFQKIYHQFAGDHLNFDSLVNSTKKMIMLVSMASEINALAHQIDRISEKNRWYRDFTLNSLTFTIREVIACLQVYRTYLNGKDQPSKRDQDYIEAAVAEAMRRNPRTARALFEFIRDTLLLRNLEDFRQEDHSRLSDFAMKFQQITGPVMAKGVEDTAFYIYNRLVSLNEVGGHPQEFGISVEAFHQKAAARHQQWPQSLLTTSTHDTKRSEDVRARINVLSEIPLEWKQALTRWSRLNAYHKSRIDGKSAPDRNEEYLFYQSVLGVWPDGPTTSEQHESLCSRLAAYMLKATREAKVHTSWVNPNEAYEAAVQAFVTASLENVPKNLFLKDLPELQQRVSFYGRLNALAQLLLKMTSPGVPDFYQGTELWNYSLVDPDNRQPVDYERRQAALSDLKTQLEQAGKDLTTVVKDLMESAEDGRVKLFLIYRTLNFRRQHSDLFSKGDYVPLEVVGEQQRHVCAFLRSFGNDQLVVAVPRLVVGLTGGVEQVPLGESAWLNTRILLPTQYPKTDFRNVLTGETLSGEERSGRISLSAAESFRSFPFALLSGSSLQPYTTPLAIMTGP